MISLIVIHQDANLLSRHPVSYPMVAPELDGSFHVFTMNLTSEQHQDSNTMYIVDKVEVV